MHMQALRHSSGLRPPYAHLVLACPKAKSGGNKRPPDGGRRISLTGSLVGWSSLRTTRPKEAFQVIVQASFLEGGPVLQNDVVRGLRFWTKKTVQEAIRLLVKRNKLRPPTAGMLGLRISV